MSISLNYDNLDYIVPGVYEAIVQNTSEEFSKSGTKYIAVSLTVRNDINQQCKNKKIEYRIWTTNKQDVNTIDGYVEYQVALMSKCCGLPNVIDVNSVYELSKKWIAKPIKITVSENEYNGSTYMNVTKIAESNFKEVNHKYVSENNTNNNPVNGFVPQSNNDFIPF